MIDVVVLERSSGLRVLIAAALACEGLQSRPADSGLSLLREVRERKPLAVVVGNGAFDRPMADLISDAGAAAPGLRWFVVMNAGLPPHEHEAWCSEMTHVERGQLDAIGRSLTDDVPGVGRPPTLNRDPSSAAWAVRDEIWWLNRSITHIAESPVIPDSQRPVLRGLAAGSEAILKRLESFFVPEDDQPAPAGAPSPSRTDGIVAMAACCQVIDARWPLDLRVTGGEAAESTPVGADLTAPLDLLTAFTASGTMLGPAGEADVAFSTSGPALRVRVALPVFGATQSERVPLPLIADSFAAAARFMRKEGCWFDVSFDGARRALALDMTLPEPDGGQRS